MSDFYGGKRLSQILKQFGLLSSTVHYYIREGLLTPKNKTKGGFYIFMKEDEERLRQILKWKEEGYSIKLMKQKIKELDGSTSDVPADPSETEV